VINRAFRAKADTLGAIAAAYRGAGVARFFLHPDAAAADLALAAAEAGLAPARGWQKFERLRGAPLPPTAAIAIRQVSPDTTDAAVAARLVCAAFDIGPLAEPWLARLGTDPRWQIFLADVGGAPAGTGALFVERGIGWVDWDATAPAFRGRGIQCALLAHRLRLADALGLRRTHTCTGLPTPGDPQHSFRNILRCGFKDTTARPNWQPDAPV
jgi:GNAT superfamily N-acetyltransferase